MAETFHETETLNASYFVSVDNEEDIIITDDEDDEEEVKSLFLCAS